jgi:acetylornithine deacetylase
MTVTSQDVVDLVGDLVRIESVTPWLIPGGAGETGVAHFLADWLSDLPVDVVIDEIEPGRTNLLATLHGTGGGPTLCLNAHADTVGFEGWPDAALTPRIEGDRLYGLGAADDKGCCAAAVLAMRELAGTPLRGDLVVACVADEEGVSIGTEHLVEGLQADAAIVLEPDALPRLVVEHQGFGWIDVVVHGRAAHGSAPEEGLDAIVGMAEIVSRMHRHDLDTFAAYPDRLNGRTVFHTGTVQGGTDYATYPSLCTLGIEVGTQPGERLADRVREIESMIQEVSSELPGLEAEVIVRLEREPFVARGHESLMACLNRAAEETLGTPLTPTGLNAWTDAALMQQAGIPTLLLGPLGGNFHAPDEWLSVSETVSLVDLIVATSREYLA